MADTLNLAYKGESSDDIHTATYDGTRWSGDGLIYIESGEGAKARQSIVQSNYGPTALDVEGAPYLIYKGAHSNSIYQAHKAPSWAGNTEIVATNGAQGNTLLQSNYTPGAAVFRNLLHLGYKAYFSNDLYMAYRDLGGVWRWNAPISELSANLGVRQSVSPQSNYGPSLAALGDELFIVYKGESSNALYGMTYDGSSWKNNDPITIPDAAAPESNYTPVAVAYNGRLYIIYKGAHSNTLYYAYYDPTARSWQGNTPIDIEGQPAPKSNQTPGAMVFGGELWIAYKGESSNDLYTAHFDGDDWYGGQTISTSSGGAISPKSNYGPGMYLSTDGKAPLSAPRVGATRQTV